MFLTLPEFRSTAPVVKTAKEIFYVEVNHPINGLTYEPTEVEVIWIRESTAQASFCHGDVVVKIYSTFADWNDFLGCIESSIEEGEEIAENLSVNPSSSASIEVELTVSDRPVLLGKSQEAKELNAKADAGEKCHKVYIKLPEAYRTRKTFAEVNPGVVKRPQDPEFYYPTPRSLEVGGVVVWDTKQGWIISKEQLMKKYYPQVKG